MKADFSSGVFLTDRVNRAAIFLTLLLPLILVPFSKSYGDDNSGSATTPAMPDAGNSAHQEVKLLLDSVRQTGSPWMANLPSAIRSPSAWALNNVRAMEDEVGIGDDPESGADNAPGPVTHPVSTLMNLPPPPQDGFWFSPGYHHKNFLPFDDAMEIGMGARHNMFDNRMQLEMRPYYGQNWMRPEGYFGSEFSLGLARGGTDAPLRESWGKISVGFMNGDSQVMDHGHGFDMHGELRLNEELGLHAGIRENEDANSGSYIMLRWKLLGD